MQSFSGTNFVGHGHLIGGWTQKSHVAASGLRLAEKSPQRGFPKNQQHWKQNENWATMSWTLSTALEYLQMLGEPLGNVETYVHTYTYLDVKGSENIPYAWAQLDQKEEEKVLGFDMEWKADSIGGKRGWGRRGRGFQASNNSRRLASKESNSNFSHGSPRSAPEIEGLQQLQLEIIKVSSR